MTTFRKRGAIINMSSSAGELPTPQMTVYAATKVKKIMYIYNFCVFFHCCVVFFSTLVIQISVDNCSCFFVVLPSFCMFVCFVLEKRPLIRQLKCLVSYADERLVYLLK